MALQGNVAVIFPNPSVEAGVKKSEKEGSIMVVVLFRMPLFVFAQAMLFQEQPVLFCERYFPVVLFLVIEIIPYFFQRRLAYGRSKVLVRPIKLLRKQPGLICPE
jgi:hypothetical protein